VCHTFNVSSPNVSYQSYFTVARTTHSLFVDGKAKLPKNFRPEVLKQLVAGLLRLFVHSNVKYPLLRVYVESRVSQTLLEAASCGSADLLGLLPVSSQALL